MYKIKVIISTVPELQREINSFLEKNKDIVIFQVNNVFDTTTRMIVCTILYETE
jgi:hypothetical protein